MKQHLATSGGQMTPEYRSWHSMKQRCNDPRSHKYNQYGGRGIAICDRWKSFAAFLEDMGFKPSAKHSIDRINVNGNYEPSNCKWSLPKEQARNRTNNRWITIGDESRLLVEWSELSGVDPVTITGRIRRGWSLKDAVWRPPDIRRRPKPKSKSVI